MPHRLVSITHLYANFIPPTKHTLGLVIFLTSRSIAEHPHLLGFGDEDLFLDALVPPKADKDPGEATSLGADTLSARLHLSGATGEGEDTLMVALDVTVMAMGALCLSLGELGAEADSGSRTRSRFFKWRTGSGK